MEIARRVDFEFEFGKFRFPIYQSGRESDLDAALQRRAREGLAERLKEIQARGGAVDPAPYQDRLERELPVIRQMAFAGYLLIVADFMDYARQKGIPVGPGRGSVVGSLVSYSLRITEVDPVEHRLLFERWLNPGRKSMPDIDMDFCWERRDEMLDYARQKYGAQRVAQIITFGTLKGKQAIRDVGRVLGLSFAETDKIVKLYPAPKQGRDFPLEDALRIEPRLAAERQTHPELFNYAFKLEGLLRHASRHPAGVVISDEPLADLVPLYVDKENNDAGLAVTQYAMKGIEEIGLIKFDFLALKNLTLIHDTLALIRACGAEPPELARLRLDDADTFRLLSRGDTVGVFQMEGSGMRRFITELKPSSFEDVIAAISLFRPGTLDSGMVDPYIRRKHGRERVDYDHALLEPVLRDTYGIILYQEQVMQVAQALAGYSLQEADMLRAAMGKKNKAQMERERARFIEGARSNSVAAGLANSIFEKIETFASYGFNRSHAAAYALTTYTTAYLKAHHPHQFMAALMSLDMDDNAKTYKNINACREMAIPILPPDVNQSRVKFTVIDGAIRFGLGAIRGVGSKTAEAIIAVREQSGAFAGLADLCQRLTGQWLNRRVLEALIKCGAFDSTAVARAALMAQVDDALKLAQRMQSDAEKNQMGLFGATPAVAALPQRGDAVAEWGRQEKLAYEREALGFYITAHPLDKFEHEVARMGGLTTAGLSSQPDGSQVQIAGVIHQVKLKNSRSGKRYATFSFEDRDGTVEAIAWPETYQKFERLIHQTEPVALRGKLDVDDERAQIIIDDVRPLGAALAASVREVRLHAPIASLADETLERLRTVLTHHAGKSVVYLHLGLASGREAVLLFGDNYRVAPT
ncbi:MAG: DNA polymerase III subunit alpha, partial [Candidatus Binataceae bacterium]